MANFAGKILYLKTLMVEDGVGEVLERLKTMLMLNKQKLNDLFHFEGRLRKLNSDLGFEFITRDKYNSELANLRKVLLDFLDNLKPEDLQTPTEQKANRKKKNRGHLLHRIPKQMQLFKHTKCVVRLAKVMEDLLENYKMTDDTVIKSIRVAEVMEVDLQDRNVDTAFEITTPNDKEQFLDEDDFTEWIFYVKPIREGQHELTLVVTVLEEVRGKERRRNVVLEEVVTIVSEDVVEDTVYQVTGYEVGSTKVVESQPFLGFLQTIRKYSAVVALILLGSLGTWAFATESGQYRIATLQNTEASYERFIERYGDNEESKYVENAKQKLETKVFDRVMTTSEVNNVELLEEYIERFPKSKRIAQVADTLIALEYKRVTQIVTKENIQPLIEFIKRYQKVETNFNKNIQQKAKTKYKTITGKPITTKQIEAVKAKPLNITINTTKEQNQQYQVTPDDTEVTLDDGTETSSDEEITEDNTIEIDKPKTTDKKTITEDPTNIENNKPMAKTKKDKEVTKLVRTSDPFANLMIKVQGGTFKMGSNDGEDDEQPIHDVTVPTFYICKYEVTQKQWRDIMGENPSYFKGCDDCPVESVSWNDIQEFIKKLHKKTGKKYRLPTEAEWEYAARGGNKSKGFKYAGSNTIDDVAWYLKNSFELGEKHKNYGTNPVGLKKANELGIYDMNGNVYEWCQDRWHNNYKNAPANGSAWKSGNSNYLVLRGGSWYSASEYCHITLRFSFIPKKSSYRNGFRLVI